MKRSHSLKLKEKLINIVTNLSGTPLIESLHEFYSGSNWYIDTEVVDTLPKIFFEKLHDELSKQSDKLRPSNEQNIVTSILKLFSNLSDSIESTKKLIDLDFLSLFLEIERLYKTEKVEGGFLVILNTCIVHASSKHKRTIGEKFIPLYVNKLFGTVKISLFCQRQIAENINLLILRSKRNKEVLSKVKIESDVSAMSQNLDEPEFETEREKLLFLMLQEVLRCSDYFFQLSLIEIIYRMGKFIKNSSVMKTVFMNDSKLYSKFTEIRSGNRYFITDLKEFLRHVNIKYNDNLFTFFAKKIVWENTTFRKTDFHAGGELLAFLASDTSGVEDDDGKREEQLVEINVDRIMKFEIKGNNVKVGVLKENDGEEIEDLIVYLGKKEIKSFTKYLKPVLKMNKKAKRKKKKAKKKSDEVIEDEDIKTPPTQQKKNVPKVDSTTEKVKTPLEVEESPQIEVSKARVDSNVVGVTSQKKEDVVDKMDVDEENEIEIEKKTEALERKKEVPDLPESEFNSVQLSQEEKMNRLNRRKKRKREEITPDIFDEGEKMDYEEGEDFYDDDDTDGFSEILKSLKGLIGQRKVKRRKIQRKIYKEAQADIMNEIQTYHEEVVNQRQLVITESKPKILKLESQLRDNSVKMKQMFKTFREGINDHIKNHNDISLKMKDIKETMGERIKDYYAEENKGYRNLLKSVKNKLETMKQKIIEKQSDSKKMKKIEDMVKQLDSTDE